MPSRGPLMGTLINRLSTVRAPAGKRNGPTGLLFGHSGTRGGSWVGRPNGNPSGGECALLISGGAQVPHAECLSRR
jgi:hypothetical protein